MRTVLGRVLASTWKLLISFAVVYIAGALAFWHFEQAPDGAQPTIGEAFYYGIVTLSTVGYGDMYPKTRGGQWTLKGSPRASYSMRPRCASREAWSS